MERILCGVTVDANGNVLVVGASEPAIDLDHVEVTSRRTGESEEMSPEAAGARIAGVYGR